MDVSRRGFLASLLAAPIAAKLLPSDPLAGIRHSFRGCNAGRVLVPDGWVYMSDTYQASWAYRYQETVRFYEGTQWLNPEP